MVVDTIRRVQRLLVQLGGLSSVVTTRRVWWVSVYLGQFHGCWYNWEGSEAVVKPGGFGGCWYSHEGSVVVGTSRKV